ncbi:hypothetical protein MKEN_01335700 [Mycena kentingensis (nom. inval.)]|nr:hypothetical protein MKEN_01335700 [Mycena kentingensis (nom. inval.)]
MLSHPYSNAAGYIYANEDNEREYPVEPARPVPVDLSRYASTASRSTTTTATHPYSTRTSSIQSPSSPTFTSSTATYVSHGRDHTRKSQESSTTGWSRTTSNRNATKKKALKQRPDHPSIPPAPAPVSSGLDGYTYAYPYAYDIGNGTYSYNPPSPTQEKRLPRARPRTSSNPEPASPSEPHVVSPAQAQPLLMPLRGPISHPYQQEMAAHSWAGSAGDKEEGIFVPLDRERRRGWVGEEDEIPPPPVVTLTPAQGAHIRESIIPLALQDPDFMNLRGSDSDHGSQKGASHSGSASGSRSASRTRSVHSQTHSNQSQPRVSVSHSHSRQSQSQAQVPVGIDAQVPIDQGLPDPAPASTSRVAIASGSVTEHATPTAVRRRPVPEFKMTPYSYGTDGGDPTLRRSAFVPGAFQSDTERRGPIQRKLRNTMNRLSGLMSACLGNSSSASMDEELGRRGSWAP